MSDDIRSGTAVRVRDASGNWLPRTAISTCVSGHDFPVIWVVKEDEYIPELAEEWQHLAERARHGAKITNLPGMPWPAEDVKAAQPPGSSR